ncbi:hypothetical protein SAMN06265360_10711 [Haloechinothrix alba]|uniref:Uncharacterized protein n=1 Tax=Haloechinothrix alba TaxID=664784 RepID=A0A238WQJ9_9PSEU|nr:hypothetical protein [Haloechinothrix alba]SNR47939.1 hypothetical protein SAMN06265360_10711 [Haloechinothrix alba]
MDKNNLNIRATMYANKGWDRDDAYEQARKDLEERGKNPIDRARAEAKKVFGDNATDADAYAIGSLNGTLSNNDAQAMGVHVPTGQELQRERDEKKTLQKLTEEEFVRINMDRRAMGVEPLDAKNPEHWWVLRDPEAERQDVTTDSNGQQVNQDGVMINHSSSG